MIKLNGGTLMDLLRDSVFVDNTKAKCISYALESETKRILGSADQTLTSAGIDKLPEKILDVLAVELRSPYYDETFDIDTKRLIIKSTLKWYMKAGTPEAVKDFINALFGSGDIVEWFDYTEAPYTPGTFDVIVNTELTEDAAEQFTKTIERVKNERSHIRHLIVLRNILMDIYSGVAEMCNQMQNSLIPESDFPQEQEMMLYYGYGHHIWEDCPIIPESELSEDSDLGCGMGSMFFSQMTNYITEQE